MIKLVCKKIDDTDFFYFSNAKYEDTFLFVVFTDDLDAFLGSDARSDILNATRKKEKVELTIEVNVNNS